MAVAVELVMPRLSESMEEGTVVSWLVADGAPVARGQEIAEIETDKATLPYEAPEGGVLRILVPEGTTLALGAPIGLIDDLASLPAQPYPPAGGDDDPPTETFEIAPPPAPNPGSPTQAPAAWSPAWGPQTPAGAPPQRPVPPPALQHPAADPTRHPEDEGETTEFDAIDLSSVDAASSDAPPAPPTPPTPPAPPTQTAEQLQTPWVDTTAAGGPSTPPASAPEAPAAAPAPAATGGTGADTGRYAAEELIAPPTLAPRPPERQPAASASAARIVASPVARRLASELGIDLSTLTGTGPEGRIVRADVEAAQAEGAARPPLPASAVPVAASEFTPPIDDDRAAAPIPEPDPAPEPAATAQPEEHDAFEVADAELEAAVEADAIDVVVEAAEEARAPDADDEADQSTPDPEPAPEPEAAPKPEAAAEPAPETEAAAEPAPETEAAAEPAPEAAPAPEPEPAAEARVLPAAQPGGGKGEPQIVELTRQQQTVARRMAESKATIPDYSTTVEVDAAPLLTLRSDLLATRPDLAAPSVNDLLVKAVAIALRAFPRLNGGYRDGRLELYPRINIGIATDSGGSLLVPVVHDADTLSVAQIAARSDELLAKAADGGLRPPDIASATFTVSNLGMYGVDEFTAVITPGQAAILTAGAIAARPVVRNGAVVPGQTLRLTLVTDHRAVYGLEAAQFLGRVRQLIEHPSSLLA